MATIQGTMFFHDQAQYVPSGWSESWIVRDTSTTLPQAITRLNLLAQLRLPLLATGISISYLRVSEIGTFRDSLIEPGVSPLANNANNFGIQFPVNPNISSLNDMSWTSLLLRCEGGEPYTSRAMKYLGGIPDSLSHSNKAGIVNPAWIANYMLFTARIKEDWGFLGQDNSAANPSKNITNVVFGNPTVVTATGHGLQTGNMVRISGVKVVHSDPVMRTLIQRQVNRVYQVTKLTDDTFSLVGSDHDNTWVYGRGGTARKQVKVVIPIRDVIMRRFAPRKRGRPFGSITARR